MKKLFLFTCLIVLFSTGNSFAQDYCPMKKNYWLFAEASIKNPYFGNQMMNCGKVSETLNKK